MIIFVSKIYKKKIEINSNQIKIGIDHFIIFYNSNFL